MINKIIYSSFLFLFISCQPSHPDASGLLYGKGSDIRITSPDTMLVQVFNWAVTIAGVYEGNSEDPVGPWYEAASSGRAAFCARDVSHQCISAEIIGDSIENLNMLTRFIENISESKDWCTYWEINRYNKPTPNTFLNDSNFWYNLNANFELIYACYRLYQWTGNETYINDPRFDRFFHVTLNEYVDRWQLQPDKIMKRPLYLNISPVEIKNNYFGTVRGIATYSDFEGNVIASSDLLSIIYLAYNAYADILRMRGDISLSEQYRKTGEQYKELFKSSWKNTFSDQYFAYLKKDHTFKSGSNIYALINRLIDSPGQIKAVMANIVSGTYNIESKSYLPMLCYNYGMYDKAYQYFKEIAIDERRIYPEASAGIIEGVICGLAGVEVTAAENRIKTCPHLTEQTPWITVENIPVYAGRISLKHFSNTKTTLANRSDKEIGWRAAFMGKALSFHVNGQALLIKHSTDLSGNQFSYVDVTLPPHSLATAVVSY